MLQVFGVGPQAEALYRAMIGQPHAEAAALARQLGWSDEDLAEAIAQLVALGLIRRSWDDPDALRAVPPELALAPLAARRRAEVLRQQHEWEQGRAAIDAMVADAAWQRGDQFANCIEELTGSDAIREGFERLATGTRRQLLTLAPVPAWTTSTAEVSRPLHRRLLDRGVELRLVYLASVRNNPVAMGHLTWLVESGAHVRTVPVLPLPLVVADRAAAVVPVVPDDPAAGACILRGAGAVAALCALFDHEWRHATRLGQTDTPDPPSGLSATELALLRLLVRGDTDEQVARRMGVSVRTVGRLAAALMSQLGARSRFQAGALAVEQGWISPAGDADAAVEARRSGAEPRPSAA